MFRKTFLMVLVLALAASCGGKKKGLLLLPLSLGEASSETTSASGTASVTDTSAQAATQTGGNDAALLGVVTGNSDAGTIAGTPGSSSGSSSGSGSDSNGSSSSGSNSSGSNSNGSNSGSPASSGSNSGSGSNASNDSNGSQNGSSSGGSSNGGTSGNSGSSGSGDVWPGEPENEAGTPEDPYTPVSDLCQAKPVSHKVGKEKNGKDDKSNDNRSGDNKSKDNKSSDKNGKGKDDKSSNRDNDSGRGHNESADLGTYDLSMDAANCLTGRFRIAVDFKVTGNVPAKGSSFHVKIKDLLGRQIGFINLKADKAGVIPAKGKITLSEPNQTIFFVWEGDSDERGNKADVAAGSLEITGISLYAKRSQMSSGLAGFFGQSAQNRALIWTILGGMGGLLILATIRLVRRNQTV